jgi:hypothetical protein
MRIIIPLVIIVGILAWALRPGKKPVGPRKAAVLGTVIPPSIVAIAAVIIQAGHNAAGKEGVSDISNALFIAGLCIIGAAIIVSVVFAVTHKVGIAKGMGFGICAAVILQVIELGLLEWMGGV